MNIRISGSDFTYPVRVMKGSVSCKTARSTLKGFIKSGNQPRGWQCFDGHSGQNWAATCVVVGSGGHTRKQDPLYAAQAHAIYYFNPGLWAALDATYYAGGRTSVDGALNNDLQQNSRWGVTMGKSLDLRNSIKLYFSSGVVARTGSKFQTGGIAWQRLWGAGL